MSTLTPDLLLRAYAVGVFPMAESAESDTIYWFDPENRGILPLEDFRISRRLRRTVRQRVFDVRIDTAFREVLGWCARRTDDRPATWINEDVSVAYAALHDAGFAHSVECWQDGALVGGLYGVALGGAFFGESMFSRARDASKVALVHLVARLKANGFALLDTQFVTDHLAQFGAREVSRLDYRERLGAAIRMQPQFSVGSEEAVLSAFLQSSTQTS